MRGWSRVEQTFGGEAIAIIRRDDTIIIDNAFTRMVRRPIFIDSAFFCCARRRTCVTTSSGKFVLNELHL
jgi:hypothetical protein